MITAHLPSGYVLSVSLLNRVRGVHASATAVILAGVIGAVAPDFDMAYFHLIDLRQTHHHKYITHWPVCWILLLCAAAIWLRFSRASKPAFLSLVFCLGGMVHLLLDSVAGHVWWFAPWIDRPYALLTVPALYQPWYLNFVFHWSFLFELAIWGWALFLYRRRSATRRAPESSLGSVK